MQTLSPTGVLRYMQHAALAALDSLLRLRVCKDAPAWISGELHRSTLAPPVKVRGHHPGVVHPIIKQTALLSQKKYTS